VNNRRQKELENLVSDELDKLAQLYIFGDGVRAFWLGIAKELLGEIHRLQAGMSARDKNHHRVLPNGQVECIYCGGDLVCTPRCPTNEYPINDNSEEEIHNGGTPKWARSKRYWSGV